MPSRRGFLRLGMFGMGVLAMGHGVAVLRRRSAPGELDDEIVAMLLATAECITGVRPLRGNYEHYFRHHAASKPGYRALYLRFCELLHDHGFAHAEPHAQARIIEAVRATQLDATMAQAIVRETLAVFERTDAWLQLGYKSWPGSARGLDLYREAPT